MTLTTTAAIGVWITFAAAAVGNITDGKKALKAHTDEQNPLAQWKWSKSPGDGVTRACFQCNAHENCTKEIRVVEINGDFCFQEKGKHTLVDNLKKRKNSTLTIKEDDMLKLMLDTGAKPGSVLVAMTKKKYKELKDAGENPLDEANKREGGGLAGAMY